MKSHKHICGDKYDLNIVNNTITIDTKIYGCGHIFKHTKSKEHRCPKCKNIASKVIYEPNKYKYIII